MMKLSTLGFVLIFLVSCTSSDNNANAQDLGFDLTENRVFAHTTSLPSTIRNNITLQNPARLLIIGDSLAQGYGMLIEEVVNDRNLLITVANAGRTSTGLARIDYYDWVSEYDSLMGEIQPDIVVAHFGTNDMQAIRSTSQTVAYSTAEWDQTYRRQVEQLIRINIEHNTPILFIGPGPDRNLNLDRHLRMVAEIFEENARHYSALYIPLRSYTSGPDGEFVSNIVANNQRIALRTSDGSHFTMQGYRFAASLMVDLLQNEFPQLDPNNSNDRLAHLFRPQ